MLGHSGNKSIVDFVGILAESQRFEVVTSLQLTVKAVNRKAVRGNYAEVKHKTFGRDNRRSCGE